MRSLTSELDDYINKKISSMKQRIMILETYPKIVISATEPTALKYLTGQYIWIKTE